MGQGLLQWQGQTPLPLPFPLQTLLWLVKRERWRGSEQQQLLVGRGKGNLPGLGTSGQDVTAFHGKSTSMWVPGLPGLITAGKPAARGLSADASCSQVTRTCPGDTVAGSQTAGRAGRGTARGAKFLDG